MSLGILVTAGPTHEPIDAVRYLANRSSGAMGLAIAAAARDAGHDVTLLLGPTPAAAPTGVTTCRYESTADLQSLLDEHFPRCDVLVMAAAVADYRPRRRADGQAAGKLERSEQGLTLELESTPDLVAACAAGKRPGQRVIGFALETPDQLPARASAKLERKALDVIIANPLTTLGAADIDATVYRRDDKPLTPGPMSKPDFARWLVEWMGRAIQPDIEQEGNRSHGA